MNRWLITVVWLLSLALPLQGLAASAGLMCHGEPAIGALGMSDGDAPCHGSADESDRPATHAGCLACAACHGAAALPSHAPNVAADSPAIAPEPSPAALALPFLTGGLERPPRTILA